MIGGIFDPMKGKIIDSNNLLCSGWINENENFDVVKIFIDDEFIGNANLGIMGGLKNYFFFYKPNFLKNGVHNLRIKLFRNNNLSKEFETLEFIVNSSIAAIQLISVQLTNRCNLNCRWCSVPKFKKKYDMEFSIFERMMQQINSPNMVVDEIMLQTAGESLLHPELNTFLDFLGSLKIRPKTTLVTNATCLSEQVSQIILSSRGLDSIFFSVDGGTKETYEWLRRGATYEKTIDNIFRFLNLNRGQIKTGIISIDLRSKFDASFSEVCKKVDSVEIRPPHNWTGFENLENFEIINQNFNPYPCNFIKNNLVVRYNGDVTVCCADQLGRGIIGNIENNHLYDLWKKERYEIFKLQVLGKKEMIPLCNKCNITS